MRRAWGVFVLLFLMGVASGATVLRFGLDQLTDRADVIVHGKVLSKQCRLTANGTIVTDIDLEVKQPLKGVRGPTFRYTIYGGVVGDRGSAVSGAPTFDVGEEILVFLDKQNKTGLRTVIGLAQGKYTIRVVKGEKLAFRDLEGLRLVDTKSGKVECAKPEQGVSLTQLLERVRARIKHPGKGK